MKSIKIVIDNEDLDIIIDGMIESDDVAVADSALVDVLIAIRKSSNGAVISSQDDDDDDDIIDCEDGCQGCSGCDGYTNSDKCIDFDEIELDSISDFIPNFVNALNVILDDEGDEPEVDPEDEGDEPEVDPEDEDEPEVEPEDEDEPEVDPEVDPEDELCCNPGTENGCWCVDMWNT